MRVEAPGSRSLLLPAMKWCLPLAYLIQFIKWQARSKVMFSYRTQLRYDGTSLSCCIDWLVGFECYEVAHFYGP